MTRRKEITEDIESVESVEETPVVEKSKAVEFIALQTIKVYCNKSFDLIKGEKIPKDLPKEFLTSLTNSKIIKKV